MRRSCSLFDPSPRRGRSSQAPAPRRRPRRRRRGAAPISRWPRSAPRAADLPPPARQPRDRGWATHVRRLRVAARAPAQHRLRRRPRGPERQRAALGGAARHRERAAREGRAGSCASWPSSSERQRSGCRRRAIDWRDGATLPFLGEPVIVVLDPRAAPAAGASCSTPAALPGVPRLTLHVGLPHDGARRRRSATRCRAGCSARRGACSTSAAAISRRSSACGGAAVAVSSAQTRWGSAQRRRLDPPELAADPLPPADDRLRRRARTGHLRGWTTARASGTSVRSVVPGLRASCAAQLKDEALPPW